MGGAGHDELYLFQVVQGDKGQQNGGMLHIGLLIVRVGAVILVLPQLQPLGPAEHDVHNEDIAHDGHNPLDDTLEGADTGQEHAGPEQHLAQVVGAAHQPVQPHVAEAAGIFGLGGRLLLVCHALHHQGQGHNHRAHRGHHAAPVAVGRPVEHRRDLHDIHNGHAHPDGHLDKHRNGLVPTGGLLQGLAVGGALDLPPQQEAAQTDAVHHQQHTEQDAPQAQGSAVHGQNGHTGAAHGKAVAHREEIHEFIESNRAQQGAHLQHHPDGGGKGHLQHLRKLHCPSLRYLP